MPNRDTIFVTGGSGFVGQPIVQRLVEDGYRVRVLARSRGVPISHPLVEVIMGDLTKPESYEPALAGAATVIHAALTDNFAHDLQATAELRNRSAQAGVRKFLHLSTIAVYGNQREGTVIEDAPPMPMADDYARMKLGIEELLRKPSGIPEVVVLRLGCVYGPGRRWWTHGLLKMMERGRLIKVNGGSGTANLIHVSDIAAVILLLLMRLNEPFEIFNVTDGTPVSWSRYFSELEMILGRSATVSMEVSEARAYGRKWLQPSLLRRALRRLQGTKFIYPLDDRSIDGFVSRAVYSNHRVSALLGFRPTHTLETGIRTVKVCRERL